VVVLATAASAQEPPAYKALYEQAEYERALVVLSPIESVEAYQYRALCLLALGRPADATTVIRKLVLAAPDFSPSASEVPPRFVDMVTEARKALLPTLAKQAFADGRERFNEKRHEEAISQFTRVLTLAADPAFGDTAIAADLKTLAEGYMALARKEMAPPPPPVPVAEPRPIEQAAKPVEPPPPPKIVQAVAVVAPVPPVPSNLVGRLGPRVSVRLSIDAEGRVTAAEIVESSHPVYDRLILQATREWRYTPATINGSPIQSEQAVTFETTQTNR
jgi:TonB family protein